MILNEYELSVYNNIDKLDYDKWYRIDPVRPDRLELIIAIKKRIDLSNDCVFDDENCSWFKRIHTMDDFTQEDLLKEKKYWKKKVKLLKQLTNEELIELLKK